MKKIFTFLFFYHSAPYVGASLEVMEKDTIRMRQGRPYIFTNLKESIGLDKIIEFIEDEGMLQRA